MDRPFRLRRPPVTRVRLGLFFEPLEDIGVTDASEFVANFRPSFPDVVERLPLLSWQEDPQPGSVLVRANSTPAFPLVSMTSATGDREISFQADRFVLAWTFDEGAGPYPGYDELSAQLRGMFDEFSAVLVAGGVPPLRVHQAQCFYLNTVRELPGTALAVYLLTGEERVSARDLLSGRTYAGARVRLPLEAALPAQLQAGVDSESDDAAILWLRVTVDNPDDEATDPLDLAHDLLIERFVSLTPNWLREDWNKVS